MRFHLDPPRAAGPVGLGMPMRAAQEVLRNLDGYRPPAPGAPVHGTLTHYDTGLSISVGPDGSGRVGAVEIWRPRTGVTVLFREIPVFDLTADELTDALRRITRVEATEDGGLTAPDLLLAFWRSGVPDDPDDEDGRYFESVLVAAPGYYDTPADRFAAASGPDGGDPAAGGKGGQPALFEP